MAVYKVPQDVEADDKLIGPFSFRQFIYLIVVAGAIAIAWVLGNILLPLAILPLPIIVLFGALALPLRKDQPMETYLAAVVSFYFKPKKRLWQADGVQTLIEITAPKIPEVQRTKDLSGSEAEQRLSYLASLVDSGGWAVRGVDAPTDFATTGNSMNNDFFEEAQKAPDILDSSSASVRDFEAKLEEADERRRQELVQQMSNPAASSLFTNTAQVDDQTATPHLTINPYPASMHQSVLQPLSADDAAAPVPSTQPQTSALPPAPTPSEEAPSPGIINLANNPDLSIETIAHEAERIKQKESLPEGEVVISLR